MSIATLDQQLHDQDFSAADTARDLGPPALRTVIAHISAKRTDERVIAVDCLAAIGDESVLPFLVKSLRDTEFDVQAASLRGLKRAHLASVVPDLTELMMDSPSAFIRGQLARMLAHAHAEYSIDAIVSQRSKESDENARQQMTIAAAELGNADARRTIVDRLSNAKPSVRYQAIADLQSVDDPKLMKYLEPLLRDETPVENVGIEQWPIWHRVCDRAVEAVAALSGNALSFSTDGKTNYTKEQVEEALHIIVGGT